MGPLEHWSRTSSFIVLNECTISLSSSIHHRLCFWMHILLSPNGVEQIMCTPLQVHLKHLMLDKSKHIWTQMVLLSHPPLNLLTQTNHSTHSARLRNAAVVTVNFKRGNNLFKPVQLAVIYQISSQDIWSNACSSAKFIYFHCLKSNNKLT